MRDVNEREETEREMEKGSSDEDIIWCESLSEKEEMKHLESGF